MRAKRARRMVLGAVALAALGATVAVAGTTPASAAGTLTVTVAAPTSVAAPSGSAAVTITIANGTGHELRVDSGDVGFTPSCVTPDASAASGCAEASGTTYTVPANAAGQSRTACAGDRFPLDQTNTKRTAFTLGGPAITVPAGSSCEIALTLVALRRAPLDASPSTSGIQSAAVASVSARDTADPFGRPSGAIGSTLVTITDPTRTRPTVTGSIHADGQDVTTFGTIAGGDAPTGELLITGYRPTAVPCAENNGSGVKTVTGNATYGGALYTPAEGGVWAVRVFYAGDAHNDAVWSRCGEAGSTVRVTGYPPRVQAVTAAPGNASATVRWVPFEDGGSPITGYVITRSTGGLFSSPVTVGPSATSAVVPDLGNGITYTFRVAPVNALGTGFGRESEEVVPLGAPAAPTGVTASVGTGTAATLTWTAPTTASYRGPVTGYRVTPYVGSTAQPAATFASTQTTQVVSGLKYGTTYTFQVEALSDFGTGPASAASAAVTTVAPWAPFPDSTKAVKKLYADIVGRAPSASELSTAVSAMNAGTKAPPALTTQLRTSNENLTNFDPVSRLYRAYFLRIPDKGGLTYWIGQRRAGKGLDPISQSFATSAEFTSRYGTLTNQGFVQKVYENVLGRPGEASGIAYWTNQLDQHKKTRGQVMTGFSESAEYKGKQANATTVDLLYLLLLHRAPTTAEHDAGVGLLAGGSRTPTTLAEDLLMSPEYVPIAAGS